jgi:hypothetical protein
MVVVCVQVDAPLGEPSIPGAPGRFQSLYTAREFFARHGHDGTIFLDDCAREGERRMGTALLGAPHRATIRAGGGIVGRSTLWEYHMVRGEPAPPGP